MVTAVSVVKLMTKTTRAAIATPTIVSHAVELSADELSCIGNCTSKVKAFQMRAAEVLMDQDAKKREANMKQMMHQQRPA